jgi:hypothetical protein
MKQTSKQLIAIATASVLVIGTAGAVFAHGYGSGGGPGWGGHHSMMGGPTGMHGPFGGPGRMGGGFPMAAGAKDLDQLKASLGITADQEAAWTAYADAVAGKAALQNTHRESRFGGGPITADQRLEFRQQGAAQMQKLVDATRDLHAVLTPAQKAGAGNLLGPRCAAW